MVTWTRDEAITGIWVTRDIYASNLDGITWEDIPDSYMQYAYGSYTDDLNVAFNADIANCRKRLSEWANLDEKNEITNPSENSKFVITPGDIIIFTVTSIGAANVKSSGTFYFSEQL